MDQQQIRAFLGGFVLTAIALVATSGQAVQKPFEKAKAVSSVGVRR